LNVLVKNIRELLIIVFDKIIELKLCGFAISIETPPVDCQFGNAANMFSNFLTIIASLDFC
jgi:hypothetical protein